MDDVAPLHHLPGFYEPFSAISHLAGAGAFLVLGTILLRRGRGDRSRMAFLSVFAGACVLQFALSGVYHMLNRAGTASHVLARLDQSAIFVLIAASFTPAHGILLRGRLRWGPLLLIWTAAIVGIVLKSVFFTALSEGVSLAAYLVLGWLGLLSGTLLGGLFGYRFILPLMWGGVAYSVGAVMEFLRWPILVAGVVHPHEVFHLAVLAGALFHWCFNWQFADGRLCAAGERLEPLIEDTPDAAGLN